MSKVKNMIDRDYEQIGCILEEAGRFGLRNEVDRWAKKLLIEHPDMIPLHAYTIAYTEWIK